METQKRIIKDRAPYAAQRLATRLGVAESTLRGWIRTGKQPTNPRIKAKYIKATVAA